MSASLSTWGRKDWLLATVTCSLAPLTVWLVREYLALRQVADDAEMGIQIYSPPPHKLAFGFSAGLIICFARLVSEPLFTRVGQYVLSEKKRQSRDRLERFASCAFKFCYFVVMSTVGYVLMKDEDWLPPALGGRGTTTNCYDMARPIASAMELYYMVQMGYHIHSLLFLVWYSTHRNDFLEMLLHHVATILAMASSYLFNFVRIGSLVLFVHDLGDVTGYLMKCVVDGSSKVLVFSVYLLLLLPSWAYTRLWVYPVHIISSATWESGMDDPDKAHNRGMIQAVVMILWLLQGLHILWYSLFLQMGYVAIRGGAVDDIQQQCTDAPEAVARKGTSSDKKQA